MGNANGHVTNDTDAAVEIFVFNYADAYRTYPFATHTIQPNQTVKVEAAAHDSGLIVATGRNQGGRHSVLRNGDTVSVSHIMAHGDNNPSHDSAHQAVMGAIDLIGDLATDEVNGRISDMAG